MAARHRRRSGEGCQKYPRLNPDFTRKLICCHATPLSRYAALTGSDPGQRAVFRPLAHLYRGPWHTAQPRLTTSSWLRLCLVALAAVPGPHPHLCHCAASSCAADSRSRCAPPPLLLPVTQASRIAEASRARRCVRVASDESSTSAPCSPPSGAAGDLRARRRNSLNHTAVARLTKDPVLLKLLGGKQLSFIGGVKALDEQVELHGPEEGLRRMEELMRRHLSEQTKEGAKVRLPRVTGLSTRKLPAYAPRRSRLARRPGGDQARLGARRRRVRRVRQAAWGGTAPTVPQGAVMSACAAGYASPQTLPFSRRRLPWRRVVRRPPVNQRWPSRWARCVPKGGPGLSTCAPPADARRSAPPTQASARSRGYNIFPFKSRESLLPLIDALDKMGELGKCAHPGGQGTLKKGQFSLAVRGSAGKPSATAGH